MHDIGSRQEACEILSWVRSFEMHFGRPKCTDEESAPEGWKYLSRGCYRSVWLSPSGVVYKVDHATWGGQNASEVNALRASWEKPPLEGCRLPRFSEYEVDDEQIVVMEYVKGKRLLDYSREIGSSHLYSMRRKIERHYGVWDMHDENILVDDDETLVPIDFGD